MELTIETKTDEEIFAWLRFIQLTKDEGAARAVIDWLKGQGESVSLQDALTFLEQYHCTYGEEIEV